MVPTGARLLRQAHDGGVWNFAEYPQEYDDGGVVATPGWIHGVKDGRDMESGEVLGTEN